MTKHKEAEQPSPPPASLDAARASRRERVQSHREARAQRIADREAEARVDGAAASREQHSRDAFVQGISSLLGRLVTAVEGLTAELRASSSAAEEVRLHDVRLATLERASSEEKARQAEATKNPSKAFVTQDELQAALKARK